MSNCVAFSMADDQMDIIKIGKVIAKMGEGSELQKNHAKYEETKYNHGQYSDDTQGGTDIFVDSSLAVRHAKVPKSGVDEWIAKSSHWRQVVTHLGQSERSKLAEVLQDAAWEADGGEIWSQVQVTDQSCRVVRVMLVATQMGDDDCIRFVMISHKERAQCRQGLMWNPKWHQDELNQKMLIDWCTYRMFEKVGQERLALASNFLKQSSLEDEVVSDSIQSHDEGPVITGEDPVTEEDPLAHPLAHKDPGSDDPVSMESPQMAKFPPGVDFGNDNCSSKVPGCPPSADKGSVEPLPPLPPLALPDKMPSNFLVAPVVDGKKVKASVKSVKNLGPEALPS